MYFVDGIHTEIAIVVRMDYVYVAYGRFINSG